MGCQEKTVFKLTGGSEADKTEQWPPSWLEKGQKYRVWNIRGNERIWRSQRNAIHAYAEIDPEAKYEKGPKVGEVWEIAFIHETKIGWAQFGKEPGSFVAHIDQTGKWRGIRQANEIAIPGTGQYYHIVRINGSYVSALIDSGAAGNFISATTAAWKGIRMRNKKAPYSMILADGAAPGGWDGRVTRETVALHMTMQGHQEWIVFDVIPMGSNSIILGLPWMKYHNPKIDWVTEEIVFDNCQCGGRASTIPAKRGHRVISAITKEPEHQTEDLGSSLKQIPVQYQEFAELFKEAKGQEALPKHQPWDHEIPIMEGREPTFGPIYGLSATELEVLREYIDTNLAKGFIRESTSPAGSPILFVPKKNGKLRLCVDYRKLNDITIKDRYALPRADELRDRLRGAKWFTKLDLRGAYNLIRIKEGDEWKTAFRCRFGHYEYQVMPFGLTNAPASMMRLMNNILHAYLDIFVIVYLDDILVFSSTEEEHIIHVRKVLQALGDKQLRLEPDKCEFHTQRTEFLGYIITTEGVEMDPKKVEAVKDWPRPESVKDVQSFLGFANFYRRFIKGYSAIASPLTELTKKGETFEWTDVRQKAFDKLKEAFTTAPILQTFDPELQLVLETDASDYAIGACLSQQKHGDNEKPRPVAFFSRKMQQAELNYEIHDKEMLAVVEAFREWRVYLEGSKYPVRVFTDHKNPTYFTTTKQLNRRQTRWSEFLAAFNFKIAYVKGSENVRADALSRRPDYLSNKTHERRAILEATEEGLIHPQVAAISKAPEFIFEKTLREAYEKDTTVRGTEIWGSSQFKKDDNGFWRFNGRIWIPEKIKKQVVQEWHELPMHGHQGIAKTYERISRHFYCTAMLQVVREVVNQCELCIQSKAARHAPYGLKQSPETPREPWTSIAWDFVGPLPESVEPGTRQFYDSILVVTERTTKYARFIPTHSTLKAEELANLFIREIVANHGTPREIISDRDKLFMSKFWTTLTALLGIKRKASTAFHPQTDGQTERLNQTLEQYLRCYVNYRQDDWAGMLGLAQYAYNSAKNETTGVTPFFANYGREPEAFRMPTEKDSLSQEAEIEVENLKALHEQLATDIEFIGMRTAEYYNRKRSTEPTLKKGDRVYLLRKNIKTVRPSEKLDFKKLGPFEIETVMGKVTYKLKLPKTMRIHPVFHISLLEPAPKKAKQIMPTELLPDENGEYEVETILDCKWVRGRRQYLIKWKGYPNTENTWEPKTNLNCSELVSEFHRRNPRIRTSPRGWDRSGRGRGRGRQ